MSFLMSEDQIDAWMIIMLSLIGWTMNAVIVIIFGITTTGISSIEAFQYFTVNTNKILLHSVVEIPTTIRLRKSSSSSATLSSSSLKTFPPLGGIRTIHEGRFSSKRVVLSSVASSSSLSLSAAPTPTPTTAGAALSNEAAADILRITSHEEDLTITRQVLAKFWKRHEKAERKQATDVARAAHHDAATTTRTKKKFSTTVLSNVSSTAIQDIKTVVAGSDELTTTSQKIKSILQIPAVEVTLGVLVLCNSLAVAVDTLPTLPLVTRQLLDLCQLGIAYLFAFEFVVRWWSCRPDTSTWKYFSRPLVLIDVLVVILPLVVECLHPKQRLLQFLPRWLVSYEGLQNLRLLRILRLQRPLEDRASFARYLQALGLPSYNVRPYQLQFARVILSVFTLVSVAAGLIYAAEYTFNPHITNYFDALYFTICTLTTVGYGDIAPCTSGGRLAVCCSILAGIFILPFQTASLGQAFLTQSRTKQQQQQQQQQQQVVVMDESQTKATTTTSEASERVGRTTTNTTGDTTCVCQTCGVAVQPKQAKYCWSCGSKRK